MATPARIRSAYRALLRSVDRHVTAVGGNTLWREAVRTSFREPAGDGEAALRRAEDLALHVSAVNEHKVRPSESASVQRRNG